MPRRKASTDGVLKELRAFGLAYPGAHTKSPWPGHLDLAVNDKTFAYLSLEGEPLRISCKLPISNEAALMLPFTQPTAYGLGRSGWVSADFADGPAPPVDLLKAWIDESYRAQAPKRLVKQLGADAGTPDERASTKRAPRRKPRTKTARAKKRPSRTKPRGTATAVGPSRTSSKRKRPAKPSNKRRAPKR